MEKRIPVWKTLSDAFIFVADHLGMLFNALIIPLILFVAIEFGFLFLAVSSTEPSPALFLKGLAEILIYAWMINVSCRVVITQTRGSSRWTAAETWTAIWLLCLTFVITLLSGAVAFAIFAVLSFISAPLGMIAAGITFMILHVYLFARFILVFPATAMGDKASFREAWEMSAGNGWRLVFLFFLVPFLYFLVGGILHLLLPIPLFLAILAIIGIFFILVGVVAVSLAYKYLKN